MRAIAGFLIETCAGQGNGIGGFVTHGFVAAQNYVSRANNTYEEDLHDLSSKSGRFGFASDANMLSQRVLLPMATS